MITIFFVISHRHMLCIRVLCLFSPSVFYHIVQLTLALPLPSKSTERIELPTMWISRTFVDVRVASAVLLVHQHSLRMQQRIHRRSCTPRMLFAWERNPLAIFVEERACTCAHTFRDPRFVSQSISRTVRSCSIGGKQRVLACVLLCHNCS